MGYPIRDLESDAHREACAVLLYQTFLAHTPAWPELADARAEVADNTLPGRVSRVMLDGERVVGWVGAQPHYDGKAWELHPLVVEASYRGRGLGRLLVEDIEAQVAARGASMLWLGTDDEDGRTSLYGLDIWDDPLSELAAIRDTGKHPFAFYQAVGFQLVGVFPDANGPGKPDILMAKPIR